MELRVWWIPQLPCKPFHVYVDSVEEGVKIMDVLADYDSFQFENNIKPDYANVGGLQLFEVEADVIEGGEGEWTDWCDGETGEDDPRQWLEDKSMVTRHD